VATVTEAVSSVERRNVVATENPESTGVNFWSFTVADRCINAIAFLTTVSMFPTLGLLFTVVTPVVWFIVMFRWENGRTYYLFIKKWQDVYLALTRSWEAPKGKTGRIRKRLFQSYPIDFTTATVGEELGFIDLGRYDAIVLSAKGSEIGAMSLEGQLTASQKIADIGRYVAARVKTRSVGVSYLFRRRPADVFQAYANTQNYLDPDVAVPEALLPDINLNRLSPDQRRDLILHTNLDQVRGQMQAQGSEPMRAMVFTLQRDLTVANAIKKNESLPSDEVPRLTAQDIAVAALSGLEDAGVTDPHVLDLQELNGFVRGSWDVADIDDYQALKQEGNEKVLRRSRLHLPQRRIRVYNDYIVTDNTMHAVLRITKVPPLTRPDYFPQLFRIPWPWISVALVGEAASSGLEYQVTQRAVAIGEILDERFRASKAPTTAKKEALRRKREEDLADNPYAQSYVILVAVSCPIEQDPDKDPEVLEKEAHRKLEDAMAKVVIPRIRIMRCEAKRVTGRSRQLESLFMATTGIPV
jgi:hypothetical protein